MKIKKFVEFEQEVEIDISTDDITEILSGKRDFIDQDEALRFFGDIAKCFNAVPDEVISGINPQAKATIANYLLKQAERFGL
jgi:hypothetical protein